MRFLTKYSFFSNVFAIIVVVFGVLYIGTEALEGGKDPDKFSPASSVELTAYDFHYNSYDENGKLETYFIAQKLEQFVNQDTKMVNILEKSYDEKTGEVTWDVKSHYATTKNKTGGNLIHLYDGVNSTMYTKKKDSNSNKNQGDKQKTSNSDSNDNYTPNKIHILTSEMYYNAATKDFNTKKFVRMYDPDTGNNTTGIGIVGNSETKKINLNKDVRSYYAFS